MSRRVNHRQLEAFQAVFEAGTVTAAAERLYVTQPAVTRLIRDLEHFLGFALFERRAGRLIPTAEAGVLHDEVQRSFIGLERIIQTARDVRTMNAGSLRIAAMPSIALGFLPRVIARFSDDHPDVSVSLQIRSSTKVAEWMPTQQIDLGIAAVDHVHPSVERQLLLETGFVAVLPEHHRLAARDVLAPSDFSGEDFISLGHDLDAKSRIDQIFDSAGVSRRLRVESQLSLAICNMVIEGLGVSLVDPITAAEFDGKGLVARPMHPTPLYRYSVLLPRHRPVSNLTFAMLAVIKAELRRNPLIDPAGLVDA